MYSGEGNLATCAEFNFACDPEAAHIVLSREGESPESLCPVYITPWETCYHGVHFTKVKCNLWLQR